MTTGGVLQTIPSPLIFWYLASILSPWAAPALQSALMGTTASFLGTDLLTLGQ